MEQAHDPRLSPGAGFVVSGIGVLGYARTLLVNMLAHRICTDATH